MLWLVISKQAMQKKRKRKKNPMTKRTHPSPYHYYLLTLNHSGFREVGRAAGGEDGVQKTATLCHRHRIGAWLAAELVFSRVPLCAFDGMIHRLRPPFCEELQRKEFIG